MAKCDRISFKEGTLAQELLLFFAIAHRCIFVNREKRETNIFKLWSKAPLS